MYKQIDSPSSKSKKQLVSACKPITNF